MSPRGSPDTHQAANTIDHPYDPILPQNAAPTNLLLSLALLVIVSTTNAVSTRNYAHRHCSGRFGQCTDLSEFHCCDCTVNTTDSVHRPDYESSSFRHPPFAGLGLTCGGRGRETCGRVNGAPWRDGSCARRGGELAGSFWFSCRGCPFPGGGVDASGDDGRNGNDDDIQEIQAGMGFAQELLDQKKHLSSVGPDIVSVEGHLFPVNYETPREVTEDIYRVFDNPVHGYKDLPKEVRGYELVNVYDSM
ncbi:hypothetical protein N7510_007742 [Penicillium lagena]|uniref:uncharacterized protein n=1 Tax=Penicillium lagena TaxID=94218 RepID=UPI002540359C|nr:uncharacterized protein N7510_007742 [Penicillium lagena]KAJ5611023.1 hypothetical protein N7510_007742 [Penicillium lagena]